MPASLLISMAEKQTDFDEDQKVMQLDDNCTVDCIYTLAKYIQVCNIIKVSD
jgi:hypothetical protein